MKQLACSRGQLSTPNKHPAGLWALPAVFMSGKLIVVLRRGTIRTLVRY